jgi:hypothetical protein
MTFFDFKKKVALKFSAAIGVDLTHKPTLEIPMPTLDRTGLVKFFIDSPAYELRRVSKKQAYEEFCDQAADEFRSMLLQNRNFKVKEFTDYHTPVRYGPAVAYRIEFWIEK